MSSTAEQVEKDNLTRNLQEHLETRLEFTKLIILERTSAIITQVVFFAIIGVLGIFFLSFITFSAAFVLADILGGFIFGFLVISVVYLICLVVFFLFRGRFSRYFQNMIIASLFAPDENENLDQFRKKD